MRNVPLFTARATRPRSRARHVALGGLLALLAAGAGASSAGPAGWQTITPDASIVGVDGKNYAPSCSGFPGTDPSFRFFAKKSPTGSRKTVVYFEGGGACWDNLTCSFPIGTGQPNQFYVPTIPPGYTPEGIDGIFRADAANPVNDWNKVYIPYCTGDIHVGSSTHSYTNAGTPLLPPAFQFTLQHRGFDNFMAVLAWMKAQGDKPQQVLVTGVSAGGYGATANFPWIADTFKTAHVALLADASQGVTTVGWDSGTPGRGSWNPQLLPSVFGPDPGAVRGSALITAVARTYPRSKVAQFTTAVDGVQVGFYGLMKSFYGPGGNCPNPAADWNQQMLQDLAGYRQALPNYRHYLAAGTYHTLLRDPIFYTEASAGQPFADWLENMLKNQGGTGGQGGKWFNRACAGCLQPLPCPTP